MRKDTDKDMTHTSNHIWSLNKRICHSAVYTYIVCVRGCTSGNNLVESMENRSRQFTRIYNSDMPCSSRTTVTATTGPVYHLLIIPRLPYQKLADMFSLPLSRLLCFLFCFDQRPFFLLSPALHVSFCSFSCNPFPISASPSVSFGTNEDIKISNGKKEEETWEKITASILRENADERTSNYTYELVPDILNPQRSSPAALTLCSETGAKLELLPHIRMPPHNG